MNSVQKKESEEKKTGTRHELPEIEEITPCCSSVDSEIEVTLYPWQGRGVQGKKEGGFGHGSKVPRAFEKGEEKVGNAKKGGAKGTGEVGVKREKES